MHFSFISWTSVVLIWVNDLCGVLTNSYAWIWNARGNTIERCLHGFKRINSSYLFHMFHQGIWPCLPFFESRFYQGLTFDFSPSWLQAVSGSASPWITNNNLGGNIQLDEFSLSLRWSKIGNLHVNLVRVYLQFSLCVRFSSSLCFSIEDLNSLISKSYTVPFWVMMFHWKTFWTHSANIEKHLTSGHLHSSLVDPNYQ